MPDQLHRAVVGELWLPAVRPGSKAPVSFAGRQVAQLAVPPAAGRIRFEVLNASGEPVARGAAGSRRDFQLRTPAGVGLLTATITWRAGRLRVTMPDGADLLVHAVPRTAYATILDPDGAELASLDAEVISQTTLGDVRVVLRKAALSLVQAIGLAAYLRARIEAVRGLTGA